MKTNASIGFGTLFKVLVAGEYVAIGEQTAVKPFAVAVDSVDASHEQSPNGWREFIPGLKDGGEASFDINYVPGSAAESQLMGFLGTVQTCRTVFPSGAHADYDALITGIEPDAPLDDKMSATVTLKITGEITVSQAAAPTNSVLPAISGVLATGETLTAYPGVWANEPTSFTYQWKNAGANIGGATSKTYVVQAGDAGDQITVAVTGANSAGNATAVSAPVVIGA